MTTAAGWYDEAGRQLVVASVASARACFYIGEAVGLLSGWAVSPSGPSRVLKPQWSPVRAVLTVPIPAPVRSYGENWQIEVAGNPAQAVSLQFQLNGQQYFVNLGALSAPTRAAVEYAVDDTMLFRNNPAQLLSVSVNTTYSFGGIELPRALQHADYYSIDDRSSTYLWSVDEGMYLRAYDRTNREELSSGISVSDTFRLFIAGHLF